MFNQIGVPALCFCYASAIVLFAQKPAWNLRFAPLIPVGGMALRNYILHILIFNLLAHSLRFFAEVGPLLGIPFGPAVFLLEVLLSAWWMRRFRFGPAEWLWRTLAYRKVQPMRMQQRAADRRQSLTTTV